MNRIVSLALLISVLQIGQSNAQLLKCIGAKVAVTWASQKFDYANPAWQGYGPDAKRRTGVNAAIYAEWLDVPFVSVVTQLEYAQRGYTEEWVVTENDPTPVGTVIHNNRLDYLSLPVLLKVSATRGVISPYVVLGPRIDLLLGYRDNFFTENATNDQFKKTTFGGSAGVGLELTTVLPVRVSLEFRYNVDLVDSYATNVFKVRNNAYDLWLGVAL